MNLKITKKSLLLLFLATIFIVAFNWQFTYIYPYLIEHFRDEKLSILYAHLFIYIFLVFIVFLFSMNLLNHLFKSKIFITVIAFTLFMFYGFSYEIILAPLKYFKDYPLSDNELMLMVFFVVTILIYGSYSFIIVFFNKLVPFSHSLVFLFIGLTYSAWFINLHCYPISTILTRF